MTKDFNPIPVEQKWQKKWEEAGVHLTNLAEAQDPFYAMVMFPYPSGDKLHVGHWYNFAPADSFARYQRMLGKDVFEPMGFDAFGLPAENYAIKTGIHPNESIKANVLTMIEQLKRMGCMYDWDKTLNTSQPEYYQWTQWLFLQMFKNGLSYKKLGNVNWCPKDQTVLANEQVTDGKCERCGTDVIQKPLEQWYWKITQYADRLIDGLADLDWPNKTKIMQTNWIGRSEGAEIEFNLNIARGSRGINSPATRCVHLVLTPKNRSEFFEDETEARSILRILDSVARRHDIVIHEAAAMNGHVHLLISFDRSRDLGTDIVKKLKGASAR
ncbi:MAG: leucyl-tRNA synthetase, partial [Candidatus Peribacteria bacterium]|nr:leucyl-tRNA synthetase [Candidatus Peribacteria bacterium]